MSQHKDNSVKLHTGPRGEVWFTQSGMPAMNSTLHPEAFAQLPVVRHAKEVRLLGTAANARLIVRLYEARLRRSMTRPEIHVGSPAVCFRSSWLQDPEFVLYQLQHPSSVSFTPGYWHVLNEVDYNAYLLTMSRCELVDDKMMTIFRYHPAWRAATFVATCDLEACCQLVCEIVYPRWYGHPDRPNRVNRLWSYLGLFPSNFQGKIGRYDKRAALVYSAWAGKGPGDVKDPRNFLWRISRSGSSLGMLHASRKFVQFLSMMWVDKVTAQFIKQPQPMRLFRPDSFFKKKDELTAFQAHITRMSNVG